MWLSIETFILQVISANEFQTKHILKPNPLSRKWVCFYDRARHRNYHSNITQLKKTVSRFTDIIKKSFLFTIIVWMYITFAQRWIANHFLFAMNINFLSRDYQYDLLLFIKCNLNKAEGRAVLAHCFFPMCFFYLGNFSTEGYIYPGRAAWV